MSCKTMSIDLANVPPVPIQIGVAGENAFRTITFDASTWGADFPDATYTVVYKRSDGYIYPVLVNAAADAIVWSPTDTDTAVSGNGQIEVRLLDGETIGKTIVMQTFVAPSLSGDESEPSTPAPDWVNDVAADADRAEAAVEHYPKIVNGVWHVWSVDAEDFVSTGIEAQGEDGYSPTVTVTEIEGGHRVTITDATGAHTFDVMDGQGGTGGAVESVNGQTGTVVLDASDVGALPDDTPIPAAVTERTVAGWGFTKNTGDYSKPDNGIPKTDLAEDVRTSLGRADTALQTAPVESVNGKTGVVVLDAEDVGALQDDTVIPSQIGQLSDNVGLVHYNSQTLTDAQKAQARTNIGAASMSDIPSLAAYRTASAQDAIDAAQDSAIAAKYTKPSGGIPDSDIASAATWNAKGTYSKPNGGIPKSDLASAVQTSLGKADTALQSAPVTSVNNKTGAVVLDASDVHALPDSTVIPPTVTEQTVAGWGFTKNTGTYVKPSTGIPASDLADGVIPDISGKANAADVYTKTEVDQKLVGAMDYKGTKATVSALPTSGNKTGDVWHITADGSEWAWNGSAWEELGSAVDLSGYRTATAQDTIDAAQDQAISGKLSTTGNAYRSASIPMGELDSTSTATVMTATVDGITELRDGVCMWLRNGVITSASGFTLNVNGLGAKPCYSSLAAASRSTTIFNVNYTMLFVYNSTRVDGGCWDIVYGVDTNTTYTPVKLGFGYGTCTTAAATAAKTASISSYSLNTGGIVSIKFDNDVPANATLNISSKGAKAIYHRGAAIKAGVIKAGDTATFIYSTYYHLIAIDRKYLTLDDLPIYDGGVS